MNVQVWHAGCPPLKPPVKDYSTACPFGEAVVLQVDLDFGGYPEDLAFQWQQRSLGENEWQNWPLSAGESEMGRREIQLLGAQALADQQFRVRYRGYPGCGCSQEYDTECLPLPEPPENPPDEPWPSSSPSYGDGTQITHWSKEVNVQGWLKRLTNGLNAFDSRIYNFHDPESKNYTYLDTIEQAGPPYDGTAILSCDPNNLQEIGLIEAYETASDRVKSFTIAQRPATTAENLAIMFISARIPGVGDVRPWNIIDQSLPMPAMVGDYENDDWMPWDTWVLGPQDAVKRRHQPSLAAADPDIWPPDISNSLVARSVWNNRWVLIIPGISLSNFDEWEGIDIFINGVPEQGIPGVSDIELVIDAIKYNLRRDDESPDGDGDEDGELGQPEEKP